MKRQYNRERVIKPVDNPLESGIIKESNTKPITKITDNAIDRVPKVEISGYSDEQNDYIQHQHKELLKFARDKNDSKEVAFVFDRDFITKAVEKGTSDYLEFDSKETLSMLSNHSDLFVMHNHPSNSSFSDRDIRFFLENHNVSRLSIVKNNGNIEVVTKTMNYDIIRTKTILARNFKRHVKSGTHAEINKAIATFLKESEGLIDWIR